MTLKESLQETLSKISKNRKSMKVIKEQNPKLYQCLIKLRKSEVLCKK